MPRLLVDLNASSANWTLPESGARRIREAAPAGWEVLFVQAPTVSDGDGNRQPSAEAIAGIAEAEVYFGFGVSPPLFEAARRLRWIQSASAGVGSVLFPALVASDVIVTNAAGMHAIPMAEHVIGGLLYLLRAFDVAVGLQRAGSWDKRPFVTNPDAVREIGECRVLVIGAGGIGSAIAERLSALGARCTGIRRRPEKGVPPGFAAVAGPGDVDAALRDADVVVLAAPSTADTERILDARRLDLLPAGAIVVNVARGRLLDADALMERLRAGRLRGAVLDVFDQEPLPATSPLWSLPQVLLTPHISAVSPRRFWDRQLSLFEENWRRFVAGEPLRNVVDKEAGY